MIHSLKASHVCGNRNLLGNNNSVWTRTRQGSVAGLFDAQGVIHYEFTPEGCAVNKGMYVNIILRLMDAVIWELE
jgi:hypothetical protein